MTKQLKKKHNIKLFQILLAVFFLSFIFIFHNNPVVHADDLLETAFQDAIANENIIMLGNNKNAVGNEVFREGQDIQKTDTSLRIKKTCFKDNVEYKVANEAQCTTIGWIRKRFDLKTRPPLMVRIAKFLLRITVALAITMVLYNAVMYVAESMKGSDKVTKATNNLLYVGGGLILALSSVAIINLISSISISSLRNVSDLNQNNFRDKYTDFCDRAVPNLNIAVNHLEGWSSNDILSFCKNTNQVIDRSQTQRESFFKWILANPWTRTKTEFIEFYDWIEAQYGYTLDLETNANINPNTNTKTNTTYGIITDLNIQNIKNFWNTISFSLYNPTGLPIKLWTTLPVSCFYNKDNTSAFVWVINIPGKNNLIKTNQSLFFPKIGISWASIGSISCTIGIGK